MELTPSCSQFRDSPIPALARELENNVLVGEGEGGTDIGYVRVCIYIYMYVIITKKRAFGCLSAGRRGWRCSPFRDRGARHPSRYKSFSAALYSFPTPSGTKEEGVRNLACGKVFVLANSAVMACRCVW